MMQQEFEKLTKVKVTSKEYNVIEAAYMACQEDKQVFCKQWLKKDGIRNLLKDRLAEIKSLNSTIKELEKKIDPLEDWKPSIKYGTHYCDTFYRNLSAACERNGKNLFAVQSDAEVFIAARFGFNASKLVIIPDVETYESNRHGTVRLAKAETRKPLYVSESINYARFDVLAKAVICSGNWLTASCATTKVPISNLRGAIVSRAQQRTDPNAVCAQFSKTISKRSVFL